MNKARRSRNTWSKRIPALAVLLVSAMLCVLAVVYRGVEVTQVSVDDGGIWVTNQDRKLLGHLNYDALMLDGTVSVKSASFDIGQAGGDVTLGETVGRTVTPVRPTSFLSASPSPCPTTRSRSRVARFWRSSTPTRASCGSVARTSLPPCRSCARTRSPMT